MKDRCTKAADKQRAFKVLRNFKSDAFTWVYAWGFDKAEAATRAVIVSHLEGIQIRDLENRHGVELSTDVEESEDYKNETSNIQRRQQKELEDF